MSKPPADWISLSEAAELLAASNIKFTPDTIGRWARVGPAPEHQARQSAVRAQGPGALAAAAARGRPRRRSPAGPVRGPGRLSRGGPDRAQVAPAAGCSRRRALSPSPCRCRRQAWAVPQRRQKRAWVETGRAQRWQTRTLPWSSTCCADSAQSAATSGDSPVSAGSRCGPPAARRATRGWGRATESVGFS